VRRKVGVLLCALAAASLLWVPPVHAADSAVSIQNFSFQPQSVTINVDETVTWTMKDANTQHTVTANDNSFSSTNLNTAQTYAHTFGQAGTFSYHCNIHPSMTGTVTVVGGGPAPTQPAPAPPPQPAPAAAAAPAATTARATVPPTTAAPATTAPATTTTIAPPAAAAAGTTSSTTAAAGEGVALPAEKTSTGGGDGVSPWLIALAVALLAGAAVGGVVLRRRAA
jgi:plastocyanin